MQQADVDEMILNIVASRTPRGWLVIDREYRVRFANDAMLAIWRKEPDEVIGKRLTEALGDDEKKNLVGNYLSPVIETLSSGREQREREVCIYNQFERIHLWYLVNTYIFYDADRRPAQVAGNYVVIDKFKALETRLYNYNMNVIKAFSKAIGARDAYTMRHVENVSALMVGLAEFMRFAADDTALAYLAGIVHDVGKIGISEGVLNKPGRLNDDEFDVIRRHPVIGAEILQEIEGFASIAQIVKHHHERWDGRGYPDKLAREEIPLLSRMLAVCDTYDAMINARCYRSPFTVKQTLNELDRCAGGQFDPVIARCFIDYVSRQSQAPLTAGPVPDATEPAWYSKT